MATEEIGFKLTVEPGNAGKAVKSFKQELKEAKTEAIELSRKFGEFSPQAIEAAKRLGALKDQFADANETAKLLTGPDRFKAFANLASGLAGGFSAVQGAIGLAGGQSKEFEKALLKVNSAIALSQGLSQVADMGKYLGQAKAAALSFTIVQKANNAVTATAAAVQKLFTGAVATTTTGFKALRGAIIATGIGALVVAVGAVISNFDKLKKAVFDLIPGLAKVGDFVSKIVDSVTDFIGVTSEATRANDKLRVSIIDSNEEADRALQIAQASGATSKEVRDLKNKQYDDEIAKLSKINELGGGNGDDSKRLKELEFNKRLLLAEGEKERKTEAEAAAKKAEEESKRKKEEAKKKSEENKKLRDEETSRRIYDELEAAEEVRIALKNKQEEDRKKAEEEKINLSGKVEETKARIAEELQAQQEVRDAIAIESEERELILLEQKYDRMRSVAAGNEQLLTAITESESAARAEVQKKWGDIELQNKQEQAAKLAGILSQASTLFGKNTAAGKATAIAGATIDTYRGATAALAASSGTGPFGAALGIAQAAIIVAAGFKNIKEILKVKVPGGADTGGGTSAASGATSPGVTTTPTLQGIQSTLLTETKKLTDGQQFVRAIVVESEVTEKQERARAITQTATF